jgi:hypothetical protein
MLVVIHCHEIFFLETDVVAWIAEMAVRVGHPKACQCFSEEPQSWFTVPYFAALPEHADIIPEGAREQMLRSLPVVALLFCGAIVRSTPYRRFLPINIFPLISYRSNVTSWSQQTCFLHSVQSVNQFTSTSADVRRRAQPHLSRRRTRRR